jgi:hypothetical protein
MGTPRLLLAWFVIASLWVTGFRPPPAFAADPIPVLHGGAVVPRAGAGAFLLRKLREISPYHWTKTAISNYRAGIWYSRDLVPHLSFKKALMQSLVPLNRAQNTRAVAISAFHSSRLAWLIARPLVFEWTRAAAKGQTLDTQTAMRALHPVPIIATAGLGLASGMLGAWVQSTLARTGPVGAALGFAMRPLIGYGGSILGYSLGKGLLQSKGNLREALRLGIADIEIGRDVGNVIGGTMGIILGQLLIPVPVVGGVIGNIILGTAGMRIGQALLPPRPAPAAPQAQSALADARPATVPRRQPRAPTGGLDDDLPVTNMDAATP